MKLLRRLSLLCLIGLSIVALQGCQKDPSAIKVFVRSASNELVPGAKVVIIGDITSNPPTNTYVDTVFTNESGFASFNMEAYYTAAGEDNTVGYFDIVVKTDTKSALGYIRSRAHTTAVETVYLPN